MPQFLTRLDLSGAVDLVEQASAPATPAADHLRIYSRDNGSGATQLMAKFATGGDVVVATQGIANALASQTVQRFTDAAQRTSQLASPVLNQLTSLDSRVGAVSYWSGSAWADTVPYTLSGQFTATTTTNGDVAVTFPVSFSGAPFVFMSVAGMNQAVTTSVLSPSATGFTCRFFGPSAVLASTSVTAYWFAIGIRP